MHEKFNPHKNSQAERTSYDYDNCDLSNQTTPEGIVYDPHILRGNYSNLLSRIDELPTKARMAVESVVSQERVPYTEKLFLQGIYEKLNHKKTLFEKVKNLVSKISGEPEAGKVNVGEWSLDASLKVGECAAHTPFSADDITANQEQVWEVGKLEKAREKVFGKEEVKDLSEEVDEFYSLANLNIDWKSDIDAELIDEMRPLFSEPLKKMLNNIARNKSCAQKAEKVLCRISNELRGIKPTWMQRKFPNIFGEPKDTEYILETLGEQAQRFLDIQAQIS